MLDLDGAEAAALTNLDIAEVSETFEEPMSVCDADCEVVKEEPDPFLEEDEDFAEYGPVEDAAF